MLEQDDGELERQLELAQLRGRGSETGVGGRVVAGEARPETAGGGREIRRPKAGGQFLDGREQLVCLVLVVEREGSLERGT